MGPQRRPRPQASACAQTLLRQFNGITSLRNFEHIHAELDLRGVREHGRGRAVLVVRELDGALDHFAPQPASAHREVQVDAGEDLGPLSPPSHQSGVPTITLLF